VHKLSPAYRFLLAGFLWSFGGNLVYFFLNFHLEALGFSRQAIGLAQAVVLLSGVAFALPLAYLIPRLGFLRSLHLAFFLTLPAVLLLGLGLLVFPSLALYGLAGAFCRGRRRPPRPARPRGKAGGLLQPAGGPHHDERLLLHPACGLPLGPLRGPKGPPLRPALLPPGASFCVGSSGGGRGEEAFEAFPSPLPLAQAPLAPGGHRLRGGARHPLFEPLPEGEVRPHLRDHGAHLRPLLLGRGGGHAPPAPPGPKASGGLGPSSSSRPSPCPFWRPWPGPPGFPWSPWPSSSAGP
jgi:hypothetical protein